MFRDSITIDAEVDVHEVLSRLRARSSTKGLDTDTIDRLCSQVETVLGDLAEMANNVTRVGGHMRIVSTTIVRP